MFDIGVFVIAVLIYCTIPNVEKQDGGNTTQAIHELHFRALADSQSEHGRSPDLVSWVSEVEGVPGRDGGHEEGPRDPEGELRQAVQILRDEEQRQGDRAAVER